MYRVGSGKCLVQTFISGDPAHKSTHSHWFGGGYFLEQRKPPSPLRRGWLSRSLRSRLQVFAGTYSIGLLYLRRQFAQERLGWNVPSSVPLPLPAIAPFVGARVSSESDGVRRRARLAAVDSPMADDGTHDVFSEPWASGVGSPDGGAQEGEVPATEMRQLQAAPVSLTAFW